VQENVLPHQEKHLFKRLSHHLSWSVSNEVWIGSCQSECWWGLFYFFKREDMSTHALMHPKTLGFIPLLLGIFFLFISFHACDILHVIHTEVNIFWGIIWLFFSVICLVAARVIIFEWAGPCPYCGCENIKIIGSITTECKACKQKIVRKGAAFLRLDELK